jgi:putative ABC transport system substrate-binding protein
MRRREFITLLGGAAVAWPVAARAQQQAIPLMGFLHVGEPTQIGRFIGAFKAGLMEGGYTEGVNVAIEYRWAEGQIDRLPGLAADLVRRGVAVIVTGGAERPALAAKAATSSIPVVFVLGGDPVKLGLVPSLARPAGNVTGIAMLTSTLEGKRLGLLHEMVPKAQTIGVLIDPSRPIAPIQIEEVRAAPAHDDVKLVFIEATKEPDFEPAFAQMVAQSADALQLCASPFFLSRRRQIVALAAHHRLPAIYEWQDFVEAGGLMSYGTDLADAYRQSGLYAARILKGTKLDDLSVMQSTKFEFAINLITAKVLGIKISPMLLARADKVVE